MGKMYLLENVINKQNNQVEGFCIIKSISERTNIKGVPYLDLELFDASGSINAKLWDYDKNVHGEFAPDMIVKVRGSVSIFRDVEQLRVDRIRRYDPEKDTVDMTKLVPCAPFAPEFMLDELTKAVEGFSDPDIKKIVLHMLNQRKETLLYWPAALKLHHAHRGGLLYHTYTMFRLAKGVCEIYPALNSDLVLGGVMLHDLAKIDELTVGDVGLSSGYSVQGQLLGHISMGVAIIETAAKETGIRDEVKMLMQHIILAHHSLPEFGSPKAPMFPEAEVVATVDMLDARMYEMFDVLDGVESGGFSDRQWALDNRMLYKTKL